MVVVALTAACGAPSRAGDEAAPSSAASASAVPALPAVPGMAAEAVVLRTDEAVGGRFQVRLTDTGDQPFTVTSVALDSPGFERLAPTSVTAEYAPGRVIDLPTPYGPPVCSSGIQPAGARITVARNGEPPEQLLVPLGGDMLDRIHAEECAALAVLDVVDVAVSGLHDDADALLGELELSRRSGKEPVTAESLGRSVLLEAVADDLPVTLEEGEQRISTPLSFTPASCDPHVLAEVKQPYVFPLAVRVGDDDPVVVDLPLDQAARGELAALVDRVCQPG
jgi:hypothetical protein